VWNVPRLWAYQPDTLKGLFELMSQAFRQRSRLPPARHPCRGCRVRSQGLLLLLGVGRQALRHIRPDPRRRRRERHRLRADRPRESNGHLARKIVKDPNATSPADVQDLRGAGLGGTQIFAIATFVALRMAFSTINDALGATPDAQLVAALPPAVTAAVTYGRPADAPSP
jgi:hypothetical protein